jgi:hypothetical protein
MEVEEKWMEKVAAFIFCSAILNLDSYGGQQESRS